MGGISGFSGCVEHTSALSQLIREARIRNGDLTLVWLDLANAYGSIPHPLISVALEHYHIPDQAQKLVKSYFGDIRLRFTVENKTTRWQNVEKGIVTGCTISPILFVMGMNLIIRAAERETRGPKTASGIRLPANRGFMDDLTISTESHSSTLDSTVTRRHCILGTHEIQAQQVQMLDHQERTSHRQVPSTHTRRGHPVTEKTPDKVPRQVV